MDKQIHCLASEIVKQLFFGILLHCMLEQAQKNAPIISGHQLVIQSDAYIDPQNVTSQIVIRSTFAAPYVRLHICAAINNPMLIHKRYCIRSFYIISIY